jgi:ActR/RegA family two-component response regulator
MFLPNLWDHHRLSPIDSGSDPSLLYGWHSVLSFPEERITDSGDIGCKGIFNRFLYCPQDEDSILRGGITMKSKTIFIAYQDDLWARSLATYFHGLGYRVEVARLVSDMIKRIRNGKIHIVLLDDEIEGVNACDLVPIFKKINPKIQVIVISSEESIGLVKRLRGAGIFYQAMKPVDLREIRLAVECAFEKIERESPKEGFISLFMPKMVPA